MSESADEQSPNVPQQIIPFRKGNPHGEQPNKAYPWYTQRTRKAQDPILRMHNQTIDFYLHVTPNPEQHQQYIALFQIIKNLLQSQYPHASICAPFLNSKLYLRGTELEIYLLLPTLNPQQAIAIKVYLQQQLKVTIILSPQGQQKYQIHQLQLTINQTATTIRILDKFHWEQYLSLVQQIVEQIVELKYVYMIVSCMVRQRRLHVTLRPFLVFALVSVFYHERRKHKHRTLTENVLKFVEYYGVGPFQERRINYLGKNKYVLLQQEPLPTPFALWIDEQTSVHTPELRDLFAVLKNRYRLISNYNFDGEQSIIAALVNPCHKEFSYL